MSQAHIPNITPLITVTDHETVRLLMSSIALEEIALAHIMNAEAEKIQFILGTLDSSIQPPPYISLENILAINQSVRKTLENVVLKEVLLQVKFANVLGYMDKLLEREAGPPQG
ncbi:hypothetical protein N0M98_09675 [Paenibacillus doosanensis]|uniref:hypothetical protein n=1 Tax=Paenibacillus doosanensis TaxID=1229154 RepID=UPI0021808C73|nr:hypothetical protein [Paenibacillus doosanensis]MCS7460410.1 hypothetical protein [Paenibacillus doosanensis]